MQMVILGYNWAHSNKVTIPHSALYGSLLVPMQEITRLAYKHELVNTLLGLKALSSKSCELCTWHYVSYSPPAAEYALVAECQV